MGRDRLRRSDRTRWKRRAVSRPCGRDVGRGEGSEGVGVVVRRDDPTWSLEAARRARLEEGRLVELDEDRVRLTDCVSRLPRSLELYFTCPSKYRFGPRPVEDARLTGFDGLYVLRWDPKSQRPLSLASLPAKSDLARDSEEESAKRVGALVVHSIEDTAFFETLEEDLLYGDRLAGVWPLPRAVLAGINASLNALMEHWGPPRLASVGRGAWEELFLQSSSQTKQARARTPRTHARQRRFPPASRSGWVGGGAGAGGRCGRRWRRGRRRTRVPIRTPPGASSQASWDAVLKKRGTRHTTTPTGLKVHAYLDTNDYPSSITVVTANRWLFSAFR